MRPSLASAGPFLLPLVLAAGAVWLGRGGEAPGPRTIAEVLRPEPGTLRIAILANPPNLDPVEMSDTTSDAVVERLGNTLLRFDSNLALAPDLAEALPEMSPDGKVYAFRLRRGVRFHNGREMTAEDVKYSLTRLAEPWSKRFWIIEPVEGAREARDAMIAASMERGGPQAPISGIDAPDALTVRITLREPNPLFLLFIAMNNATIVPREEVEALKQRFGRQMSGTGPFVLKEWRDNDRVVLERFEGYFGRKPTLERVVLRVMPEEETGYQAYLNGELDIVQCPTGKVNQVRSSNLKGQLVVNPLLDVRYQGINMEKVLAGDRGEVIPFGGNPEKGPGVPESGIPPAPLTPEQKVRARKVRQAMNWAIDRRFLCDVILEGRAVPARGVIPPGMEAFDPGLAGYGHDPARARRLLEEAGFPGGKGLPPIPYHFNNQGPNSLIAQALQGMLLDVGIRTELNMMDWGAYQNFIDEGKGTFFRQAWIADYPDPENFLYVLFHSRNRGPEGNNSRLQDPGIDRAMEEARSCLDAGRRREMWRAVERRLVEEAPWVFLYHSATCLLVKPYVKGLVLTGMDAGSEIAQADLAAVTLEAGGK